jgi:hypothetical protein
VSPIFVPDIDQSIKIAQSLAGDLRELLHARKDGRISVFEGLIRRNYLALREAHFAFHNQMAPIDIALSSLEKTFYGNSDESLKALDGLCKLLDTLKLSRHDGQPCREALYSECLSISRSTMLPRGNGRFLDEDERCQIKTLMSAICGYFEKEGAYQHSFGNFLNIACLRAEAWRCKALTITVGEIMELRKCMQDTQTKMAQSWMNITYHFSAIQAALEFNVKLPKDREYLPPPLERIATVSSAA